MAVQINCRLHVSVYRDIKNNNNNNHDDVHGAVIMFHKIALSLGGDVGPQLIHCFFFPPSPYSKRANGTSIGSTVLLAVRGK